MLYEIAFESLTLDRRGQVTARRPGAAKVLALELSGGVHLELVAIPGGAFRMGSPPGAGYPDEHPQHPASVAPFYLGRYPVTQAQWAAVMGEPPACRFQGADRPVENVSWAAAIEFCRQATGRLGRDVRLPSEVEWEYACRAGTVTPFACGETITGDLADYVGEHTYAGEPAGIYRHGTTEVGAFPANPFGLHDMHGLLWEYCADPWRPNYDEPETEESSLGSTAGGEARQREAASRFRVARGGSWHDGPDLCRSAARLRVDSAFGDDFYGFRVAASV